MSNATDIILKDMFGRDAEVEYRIASDTERFRKGFGTFDIVDAEGKPIDKASVSFKLTKHEFDFGCNAFMYDEFDTPERNSQYADAFSDLFNLAVIPFYWSDLEPADGQLRFAKDSKKIYRRPAPDKLLEFCTERGITPKGHPLLWYAFFPEWVSRDPQEMTYRIEKRFAEIAERYGDKIRNWDVINEVLTWSSSWQPMPPDQLVLVFKLAEKYFPRGVKLNYNEQPIPAWRDNNGEFSPLVLLARYLRSQNLKVDSTGLQFHIFEPEIEKIINQNHWWFYFNSEHILNVMDNFKSLNMPINISEITIPLFIADNIDGEELQARVAERLYRLWFSHEMNTGIIWWNLVDGTAAYGKSGSNEGENRPRGGFFNYDLTPKKIQKSIRRLIKEEWTTNETIDFNSSEVNKFHGFYGDYDVVVKSDKGTLKQKIKLSKGGFSRFRFVLE